nr:exonuclease SbcCD subunit D [Ardenticatena sp.]
MPRILHFSDLHIGTENYGRLNPETGLSTRLEDFLRAFDFVVEYALDNDVDLVLFTGDAFKNRDPSPTHQREFARRIRRLIEADKPVFLLVGNHDMPNSPTRAHSLDIYDTLGLDRIYVGAKPGLHYINTAHGSVQVVALPWLTRSRFLAREETHGLSPEEIDRLIRDRLEQLVYMLANQVNPDEPAILAAHLTVEGAEWGAERSVMLGSDLTIPKSVLAQEVFDYVALGHIHKHQVVAQRPLMIYAGSIERIDFGERNDPKGFVVVEIERGKPPTWHFVETPTRRLMEITLDVRAEPDPMLAIQSALATYDIADAIVKVVVHCTPEQASLLIERDIRTWLKDAAYVAALRFEAERTNRLRLGDAATIADLDPRDALRRYFEAQKYTREESERLLQYAEELFQEEEA